MQVEQAQSPEILSVEQIRELYSSILNDSNRNSSQLSELVKVMDLGETKQLVINTMTQISKMSRRKEETSATRFLRKFGLGKLIDHTKDAAEEAIVESKSVSQVSGDLLDAVSKKRDNVSSMIETLHDLKDSMGETYRQMQAVVEGINEFWEKYTDRERSHLLILKSEILETMSYHEDNIVSANGTIRAAETSMVQISQMIPKLRSQVNDSMAIRGILNELEEVTDLCQTISDVASELRAENRATMETALLSVIERSVISDTHLALIDKNSKRQEEIQQKIMVKMKEVDNKRAVAVQKLEAGSARNQTFLELGDKSKG